MNVIIVIDPHPILRLGLIQLLSETFPKNAIHAVDYTFLQQEERKLIPCDLILLTLTSKQPVCPYLKRVINVYTPRYILLLNEPSTEPSPTLYCHQPLVRGLLSKEASPELITASVQLVLAGGTCFPSHTNDNDETSTSTHNHTVSTLMAADPSTPIPSPNTCEAQLLGLTKRQYEVLVLLAEGDPLKTIAKRLDISLATAKSHTETLYQRLNVNSRNAAVYAAVARGATLGWTQPHHPS